jgi:hypothetical protein
MQTLSRILCVVLFFGIIGSAWAQQSERVSKSNQALVKAKSQKIENEIARLKDHPWAGKYSYGDGLSGAVLSLAPQNGFTVQRIADIGLLDQNHGTVDWDGKRIKLSFAFEADESNSIIRRVVNSECIPVRWDKRLYLIPENGIIHFCNAVNSGSEPQKGPIGLFFLRSGDDRKEAKGKPELPEEFMSYLLDEPINATIVSIKNIREEQGTLLGREYSRNIATVVVDKGKRDGLLPGMQLYILKREIPGFPMVRLTNIGETQSEGECPYTFSADPRPNTVTVSEGWQLSTDRRLRYTTTVPVEDVQANRGGRIETISVPNRGTGTLLNRTPRTINARPGILSRR